MKKAFFGTLIGLFLLGCNRRVIVVHRGQDGLSDAKKTLWETKVADAVLRGCDGAGCHSGENFIVDPEKFFKSDSLNRISSGSMPISGTSQATEFEKDRQIVLDFLKEE